MVFAVEVTESPITADESEELQALLIESMQENEPVDVSQYRLTQEQLLEIYFPMVNGGYFPWDSELYFDYSLDTEGYVTLFQPKLLRDSQYDEQKYEQRLAELIAETCLEGMEPWQMVLNIHDRIVTKCTYDYSGINNGYGALVDGKTACYGYSRLFLEAMERLEIPCKIVIAEDTGGGAIHAWNAVELEGEWYHLDLTWDDPSGVPGYGFCRHKHFLKSDGQFDTEDNGHDFPWEVDVTCEGGVYSLRPIWENINSPIVFMDARAMLLREDTQETIVIYSVDTENMETTALYEENIPPVRLAGGNYLCASYGLSLYEGRLYFANGREIVSILPDGTDRQVVFRWDGDDGQYLISSHVEQGVVYYNLSDGGGNYKEDSFSLNVQPAHAHSYSNRVVEGNCAEGGYKEWACECGIRYITDRTKPIHDLTEVTVEEEGYRFIRQCCRLCDYVLDGVRTPVVTEDVAETTAPTETQAEPSNKSGDDGMGIMPFVIGGIAVVALCIFTYLGIKEKMAKTARNSEK